jgi:hypothetical protein
MKDEMTVALNQTEKPHKQVTEYNHSSAIKK